MPRNRVLSFISRSKEPTPSSSPPTSSSPPLDSSQITVEPKGPGPFPSLNHPNLQTFQCRPVTPPSGPDYGSSPSSPIQSNPLNTNGSPPNSSSGSPTRGPQRSRANSRPLSIYGGYQAPIMDVEDTIPELQPIFSFLNSHSNKLYQEGYFLKLDDQNTQGKPNPDRTWTECFAQLVGTVLSLWDAAELDAAGEDGEVLPKFINLTDASIKMIESLPTRSNEEQPLQHILSISTAGRNRYLLHFNSHHSLVQWTAGIRLAMFEHNTLQEAYTGALIAGKGKSVNNINVIMERTRFPVQEWVRVRFGAGVPWRRCWCVITPPDEKEFLKLQKEMKKKNPYDRSPTPALKGNIKFYDTRKGDLKKQKKLQPIATITDAHAAYAIYPQAKSLIDASTLLKIEGTVTVHSDPPSTTEGFVFIMPEVRPAVVGFEMLLRFLFPTWDTFGLYGRPGRLVASTLDSRSLMFAMPKHHRYGYLEILDVTTLVTENGSGDWSEKDWRKKLKDATGTRMNAMDDAAARSHSRSNSRRSARLSFGGGGQTGSPKAKVGFADAPATRTSRSFSLGGRARGEDSPVDKARPPLPNGSAAPRHGRNTSDPSIMASAPQPAVQQRGGNDSPFSTNSPAQGQSPMRGILHDRVANANPDGRYSSEEDVAAPTQDFETIGRMQTPEPVQRPPAFNHTSSGGVPQKNKAYHSPALRRANSRLSSTTLAQLAKAGGVALPGDPNQDENANMRQGQVARQGPSVQPQPAIPGGASANDGRSREAMSPPGSGHYENQGQPPRGPAMPAPLSIPNQNMRGPRSPGMGPPSPYGRGPNSPAPPPQDGRRSPHPPGQGPPGTRPQYGGPMPHRPAPGSRPGTSASDRPGMIRRPTAERAGDSDVDAYDILDSYGTDPGPARQHQHRGPASGGPQGPSRGQPQQPPDRDPDRPRAGALRTVGGGDDPMSRPNPNVPDINFGPTYNYGAPPRPGPQGGRSTPTQDRRPDAAGRGGQKSPEGPSRPPMPPSHGSEGRRNVPWHPAGMAPGHAQHGITPEEYVQQRAAAAPQYGHPRSPSGDAQTGRPNHGRRRSSLSMLDQLSQPRPDHHNHRPSTSGNSEGDSGSYMSARDREQVSRMTGQPLVNMNQGQRPSTAGSGLVGSIDYRERERQQTRHGANQQAAMAAQQAMVQRQQQQSAMHQQIMAQERQHRTGSPAYGGPGSFSRPMGGTPSPRPDGPRYMPPPGPHPGQQQGSSNVHPQYQGQAF